MKFAEKIKSLRKESGLSQVELANLLHVSQVTVSAWERGVKMPTFVHGLMLARQFKCDFRELSKELL